MADTPSDDHDYLPLTQKKSPRWHVPDSLRWNIFQYGLVVLLLVDLIIGGVYLVYRRPPTTLDNYQKLNTLSTVDTVYKATLLSRSSAIENWDERAIVSSLYTDSYAAAILTLGHSLVAVNVSARMILIYIPDSLSSHTLCLVSAAGWTLHPVPVIPPPPGMIATPRYRDQYTKLNIWKLDAIGIKSLVYLDADTLVLRNFDELFALPFNFAATPDIWTDELGFTVGFNAGVLFLRPSTAVFSDMLSKLQIADYPHGYAEQAFMNVYFGPQALRLPYTYNGNLAIKKRNPTLWKALVEDMRIIHYTLEKPFPLAWLEREELEAFFKRRNSTSGGFWVEEMAWWQDSFREAMWVLQGRLSQCI